MPSIIITLVVLLGLITAVRLTVARSGDTIRMKHISNISTSIKANSLGKMARNKYFYPTHVDLLNALKKTHFDIPDPYNNICYFFGSVQNEEKNTSDYIIITWGDESSTLDPKLPGVIFETSNDIMKKVIYKISPTLDRKHFRCKQNKTIPWKNDMSTLLKMKLFPTHWLKINEEQQVCIGITDQDMPAGMAECLPER